MNLGEFGRLMRRRGRNVERNAAELVKKSARRALYLVAHRSPYRSGQFRANWLVSKNSPNTAFTEYASAGSRSTAAQIAIDRGNSVIASAKPKDVLIIQNNAPYARRLNDGWSAQAPAGFVEAALREASQTVKGVKLVTDD